MLPEKPLCAGIMRPLSVPGKPSVKGILCSWERYSGLSLSELEALLDQGHWAHSGFGGRGLGRVMGGQILAFFFRCLGATVRGSPNNLSVGSWTDVISHSCHFNCFPESHMRMMASDRTGFNSVAVGKAPNILSCGFFTGN